MHNIFFLGLSEDYIPLQSDLALIHIATGGHREPLYSLHLDSSCNAAVNFHNVHVFILILLLVEERQ